MRSEISYAHTRIKISVSFCFALHAKLTLPIINNQKRGINIEQTFQRAGALRDGKKMEIDVLCVNDRDIPAIEVKSTLGVEDVDEHIERFKNFKRFFPRYRDSNLPGGVAGIVFNGGSDKYAYKQGLFVIGQTGDTVHILNDARFKPKSW